MKLSAATVAAAAGMSRQTLNRIERGEPSVTVGACIGAMQALGLELRVEGPEEVQSTEVVADAVRLTEYPQLQQLAWQLGDDQILSGAEALALYERNWRHVDAEAMDPHERDLLKRLVQRHGNGVLLV